MASRRVKKTTKAKASVRVNVNVNSKNRRVIKGRFPVPFPTALPAVRVEVQSSAPQHPIVIHQPPMMRDTTHPVGLTITNHAGGAHPPKIEQTLPQAESEETKTTGTFQGVKDYITKKADTAGDYAIGAGSALSVVAPQLGGALATAGSALKAVPKANEIYESGKKIVSSARELIGGRSKEPEIQPDWSSMSKERIREYITKNGGDVKGRSRDRKDQLIEYAKTLG